MSYSNNIDLQQEAKQVVLEEMEKLGLLAKMKAQIKSSVIKILERQKQTVKQNVEFDYMTPLHKLNKNKEILLACHLIKEFLQFCEMEYTVPIFENESNVRENIKRETLSSELSLQNLISSSLEPKPILAQLISAYQNELQNKKQGGEISKGLDDSYGVKGHHYSADVNFVKNDAQSNISSIHSSPVVPVNPGKKHLTPINFVNKSVDMKENLSSENPNSESQKFNTANISDIYSKSNRNKHASGNSNTSGNLPKLNSEDKNQTQESYTEPKFQFNSIDYNTNNKYDDEFNEVILEELPEAKNKDEEIDLEIEDSKKSITASANNFMSSYGYDSSVTNYRLDEFDHIEEVEKP